MIGRSELKLISLGDSLNTSNSWNSFYFYLPGHFFNIWYTCCQYWWRQLQTTTSAKRAGKFKHQKFFIFRHAQKIITSFNYGINVKKNEKWYKKDMNYDVKWRCFLELFFTSCWYGFFGKNNHVYADYLHLDCGRNRHIFFEVHELRRRGDDHRRYGWTRCFHDQWQILHLCAVEHLFRAQ